MIIITNDDGIYSKGIRTLYETAVDVFGEKNVMAVAPSGPRSASGMSFTFHKPLRVEKFVHPEINGYSVSGTPADCVFVAIEHLFKGKKIDLILSGMNNGSNASIQAIESSGTVAAIKFGAIFGINGIAFSLATEIGYTPNIFKNTKPHLIELLRDIKVHGFPEGVDMLNVNIPPTINSRTKWKICDLENTLYNDFVVEKKDPRNRRYYWLWGTQKKRLTKGSDCYELFKNSALTITPFEISTSSADLKRYAAASIKRAKIA
jgi:5'-nucleotidase